MQDRPRSTVSLVACETEVYAFDEKDLTPEIKLQGAKDELAQWEKYGVWAGNYVTKDKLSDDAIVFDAAFVQKATIKNRKLMSKGRLCPKGYQDPEQNLYGNDSPTAQRAALLTLLSVTAAKGW